MGAFRYILDKSSKKYRCPSCGKNTFVRYRDTYDDRLIDQKYGRCDREEKCGYHNWPTQKEQAFPFSLKPAKLSQGYSTHPQKLVSRAGRGFKQNNFTQFLKSIFGEEEVKQIIERYLLGSSRFWEGATVFWQLDETLRVRGGKILLYDKSSGKRHKDSEGKSYINWVHSVLGIKDFNLKQCLFGLHLIKEFDSKNLIIGLVESEKTAVIMSLCEPKLLWMATGSLYGFKNEMLQPIKKYNILAFPDKGEFINWQKRADVLNKTGYKIYVSDCLEGLELEQGSDLADWVIANKVGIDNSVALGSDPFNKIEMESGKTIRNKEGLALLMETFDCDVFLQ